MKSTHPGITAQNQTPQRCGLQAGVAGSNPKIKTGYEFYTYPANKSILRGDSTRKNAPPAYAGGGRGIKVSETSLTDFFRLRL